MSEQAISKLPQIRFRGFSEEWTEQPLGSFGQVAMNRRIFKHQTAAVGEIPFFKIDSFDGEPDAFISRELFEEYKRRYPYPSKGDLLISAAGSIGKVVEYDGQEQYFCKCAFVALAYQERSLEIPRRQNRSYTEGC